MVTLVVVGGGAAGFFGAINAKSCCPEIRVILLEKSREPLSKVRISGGGRCNLTHALFDPKLLVTYYPRGHKELLGPFTRFAPSDTMNWFEERGVRLKIEEDGRVFPCSDSSQTIVEALRSEATKVGVDVRLHTRPETIEKTEDGYLLTLTHGEPLLCQRLLLATGNSPQGHVFAHSFGHTIVEPVPSLFTFNVPSSPLRDLSGVSLSDVEVSLDKELRQRGAPLITHFGFSGPAILKLSAWGARVLHARNYETSFTLNWIPDASLNQLIAFKNEKGRIQLGSINPFHFPKELWKRLVERAQLDLTMRWGDPSHPRLRALFHTLQSDSYQMQGKTTHKEEFVTAGGVALSEINFKTMESRLSPGLFFAGEILDIDGLTGGFNFQSAWTTGWIAGHASL